MNTSTLCQSIFEKSAQFAVAALCFVMIAGCKNKQSHLVPPPAAPRLESNNAADNPSPLLQSFADSPISWKQLTPATMNYARDANKLILLFASTSIVSDNLSVLHALESDAVICQQIKDHFVPLLVDANACSELGMIAAILSVEIKKPVSFPFMMWMTSEGNPIAWLPLTAADGKNNLTKYRHSQEVVLSMLRESPEYIKKNSANDAVHRRLRLTGATPLTTLPQERSDQLLKCLRTLHSYYDEDARIVSNLGSLLPVFYLDLMRASAQSACIPIEVRKKSLTILTGALNSLLDSAAIDYLDGGFHHSRRDQNWGYCTPDRNALTQANMICLLAETYALTGDELYRAAALRSMDFMQKNFLIGSSSYRSTNATASIADELRHWTMESLEETLSAEELRILTAHCALSKIGNLPMDSDPRREMFRRNSLTARIPLAQAAAACQYSEDLAKKLVDSARAKLLAKRQSLLPKETDTPTPDAKATAAAASAAAALYRLTDDEKWKQHALATMQSLRSIFHGGKTLSFYPPTAYPATTDARAGLLATVAKAALDVHHITGDSALLHYATSLCKQLETDHLIDGKIEESPPSCRLVNIPCVCDSMVFGPSTTGLTRQVLIRLEGLGQPRQENLFRACAPHFEKLSASPVIQTDDLLSLIFQEFSLTLCLPTEIDDAFLTEFRRASPGIVRLDKTNANGAEVIIHRNEKQALPAPSALPALLRP